MLWHRRVSTRCKQRPHKVTKWDITNLLSVWWINKTHFDICYVVLLVWIWKYTMLNYNMLMSIGLSCICLWVLVCLVVWEFLVQSSSTFNFNFSWRLPCILFTNETGTRTKPMVLGFYALVCYHFCSFSYRFACRWWRFSSFQRRYPALYGANSSDGSVYYDRPQSVSDVVLYCQPCEPQVLQIIQRDWRVWVLCYTPDDISQVS